MATAMALEIYTIPALNDNYSYLIRDPEQNATMVIDPAESRPIVNFLRAKNWQLDVIANTHHHYDHVGGNTELHERYGAQVWGYKSDACRIPHISHLLEDGQKLNFGQNEIEVIHTPGHTLGAICYYFPKKECAFTGDTLFSLGCGRLFEGTPEQLWSSLKKIRNLPDSTLVYCGHEYTLANLAFTQTKITTEKKAKLNKLKKHLQSLMNQKAPTIPSTIAIEKEFNCFLNCDSPQLKAFHKKDNLEDYEFFSWLRSEKDHFRQ